MTEKEYFDQALEVSTEFDKYVFAHPEIADRIPQDALIVFVLEDDHDFSKRSMELARTVREKNQPIVLVKAQQLIPPIESRLVDPHVELVSTV